MTPAPTRLPAHSPTTPSYARATGQADTAPNVPARKLR